MASQIPQTKGSGKGGYHDGHSEMTANWSAAGDSPNSRGLTSQQQGRLHSLAEFIGRAPRDLNVYELRDLLEQRMLDALNSVENVDEDAENEDVAPLLLRFVNGEFHYGQRSTKLAKAARPDSPAIAEEKVASTPARADNISVQGILDRSASRENLRESSLPKEDARSASRSRGMATLEVFNVLVDESRYRHLHQLAGWVDIDEADVWSDYVRDVMDGVVNDGDRVFEAGCGVLAFLTAVGRIAKLGAMGGMDGAARTIKLVKDRLVDPSQRDNFYVGLLPYGLSPVADSSWDVIFCNSVMQYIPSEKDCRETVIEMLRITRRWAIIADICDAVHEEKAKEHRKRLAATNAAEGKANEDDGMCDYKCYYKKWWLQFEELGHLVTIRHVRVKSYTRRSERYCVYIEKNAGIVTS